jgi:hypothetical protein
MLVLLTTVTAPTSCEPLVGGLEVVADVPGRGALNADIMGGEVRQQEAGSHRRHSASRR